MGQLPTWTQNYPIWVIWAYPYGLLVNLGYKTIWAPYVSPYGAHKGPILQCYLGKGKGKEKTGWKKKIEKKREKKTWGKRGKEKMAKWDKTRTCTADQGMKTYRPLFRQRIGRYL